MARKKKKVTERSSETKFAKKIFVLSIPHTIKAKKEVIPLPEKTSLFVPKEHLINEENGFEKSIFSGEVLVSRDIKKVLKTVFTHGNIAKRYGEGGLEQDPARQQIIVYTMVTCQKHLLWYQRAELTTKKDEVIVELLEAAVPIPITVKIDSVKVIRRDTEEDEDASFTGKVLSWFWWSQNS